MEEGDPRPAGTAKKVFMAPSKDVVTGLPAPLLPSRRARQSSRTDLSHNRQNPARAFLKWAKPRDHDRRIQKVARDPTAAAPASATTRATFAANLRRERRRVGLSQEALAAASGLHRTEVSLLERGGRDPRLSTVVRVADALGVPPPALLAGLGV